MSDVRLTNSPLNETLALLKNLPWSAEECAGRLFEVARARREAPSSVHLKMAGYVTYRLDMEV